MIINRTNDIIEINTKNDKYTFDIAYSKDILKLINQIKNSSNFDVDNMTPNNMKKLIVIFLDCSYKFEDKETLREKIDKDYDLSNTNLNNHRGTININKYQSLLNYFRGNYFSICDNCFRLVNTTKNHIYNYPSINKINTLINDYSEYKDIINYKDLLYYDYQDINSYLCDSCYKELINNIIGEIKNYYFDFDINNLISSYHSTDCLDLSNSNNKFGIEIEYSLESYDNDTYRILKKMINKDLIRIESDCSLYGEYTMEIITNIMDIELLNDNKSLFETMFHELDYYNDLNATNGGHLHINKDLYNIPTLKRLVNFFIDNTDFLKDISKRYDYIETDEERFYYCDFNNLYYNDIEMSKYSPINITDNTIEFRFWGAYNSLNDIYNRYYICIGLLELSKHNILSLKNLLNYLESLIINPLIYSKGLEYYIKILKEYL